MHDEDQKKQMTNDLIEIFDEEYGKKCLITPHNTAEKMTAKGYRKASEVAWEIFDKVDEIAYRYLNDADYSGGDMIYDLNELKKKYTEGRNE